MGVLAAVVKYNPVRKWDVTKFRSILMAATPGGLDTPAWCETVDVGVRIEAGPRPSGIVEIFKGLAGRVKL